MPLLNLNLRSVIFGQDGTSFFSVLSDLCGGCELETGGDVANTVSFTLLAIKYVNNLVIYTNTNTVGMNAFLKLPIVRWNNSAGGRGPAAERESLRPRNNS